MLFGMTKATTIGLLDQNLTLELVIIVSCEYFVNVLQLFVMLVVLVLQLLAVETIGSIYTIPGIYVIPMM